MQWQEGALEVIGRDTCLLTDLVLWPLCYKTRVVLGSHKAGVAVFWPLGGWMHACSDLICILVVKLKQGVVSRGFMSGCKLYCGGAGCCGEKAMTGGLDARIWEILLLSGIPRR